MNKQVNPNLVAAILVSVALALLAVLPISIEFNTSEAEAPQAVPVARVETGRLVEYTLKTVVGQNPAMAFVGVGGAIDGVINPPLAAEVGDRVIITLVNGDPIMHDLVIDRFDVKTAQLTQKDETATIEFVANEPGDFEFYCSVPGHKDIGMRGTISITGEALPLEVASAAEPAAAEPVPTVAPAVADAVSVVRNPSDLPAVVGDREPMTVKVDLTAEEVTGVLADGTTYDFFTFDGKIPGPMLRVRVGDTVEVSLTNADGSLFPHSIDLHAVTGPGGGAVFTQTNPGDMTAFTFKAINPGLYVYHCATPSVAHHISNGMYGLILVEPEGGLVPVDKEFYVMQGDLYTEQPFGTQGHLSFSHAAMLDEQAEYFTFNGAAGALTSDANALRAEVGDTVRIYFGVGGPNATSSFHVIGEIFDRVYSQASITSDPLTDVQTTTVPPGGAAVVEFTLDVPGRYILVDHALSRLERGLAGYLYAEGSAAPDIFDSEVPETAMASGH
jgi:nitrite reductase (NO-forming)